MKNYSICFPFFFVEKISSESLVFHFCWNNYLNNANNNKNIKSLSPVSFFFQMLLRSSDLQCQQNHRTVYSFFYYLILFHFIYLFHIKINHLINKVTSFKARHRRCYSLMVTWDAKEFLLKQEVSHFLCILNLNLRS